MPMIGLSIGYPQALVVGQVYGLPGRAVWIRAQAGTIEVSNDDVTYAAPTAGVPVVARFIRTTLANSIIQLAAA